MAIELQVSEATVKRDIKLLKEKDFLHLLGEKTAN